MEVLLLLLEVLLPLLPGFLAALLQALGMAFGESALLSGGKRTANVHADTEVDCLTLDTAAFVFGARGSTQRSAQRAQ